LRLRNSFLVFALLFVVAAVLLVGTGISVIETPATMQLKKADQRRAQDLHKIDWVLSSYVKKEGRVPPSLEALADSTSKKINLRDPETDIKYHYEVRDERNYKICATFNLSNIGRGAERRVYGAKEWQHKSGAVCFEIEVEADKD